MGQIVSVKCDNCGETFQCQDWRTRQRKHLFCCKKCEGEFRHKNNTSRVNCAVCGKVVYVKPYHQNRAKNICCSRECAPKLKQETYRGPKNHQYGIKGNNNASWKSDEKISVYGYKLIRCLGNIAGIRSQAPG